jgi:hypothetical protein
MNQKSEKQMLISNIRNFSLLSNISHKKSFE